MSIATWFNETLPARLNKDPDAAKALDAILVFKITGDGGGTWTVDCKTGAPTIKEGEVDDADATMEVSVENFNAILEDFNMAMQLDVQGALLWEGDPMLATKLNAFFVDA